MTQCEYPVTHPDGVRACPLNAAVELTEWGTGKTIKACSVHVLSAAELLDTAKPIRMERI